MTTQKIIGSALKFHVDGVPPMVTIASEVQNTNAGNLASNLFYDVSIVDNGMGFGKKYSEKICATFQRLHRRHEYEGTGMIWQFVGKSSNVTMATLL